MKRKSENMNPRKKIWLFVFSFITVLFSCSDKQFDSGKWKAKPDEQYYMLNDIIENRRFLGKTKTEIIDLLDTTEIKQFKYSDNSWMFIIVIPHPTPAQKRGVEVMDIVFENEKVKTVSLRE